MPEPDSMPVDLLTEEQEENEEADKGRRHELRPEHGWKAACHKPVCRYHLLFWKC